MADIKTEYFTANPNPRSTWKMAVKPGRERERERENSVRNFVAILIITEFC